MRYRIVATTRIFERVAHGADTENNASIITTTYNNIIITLNYHHRNYTIHV